MSFFPATFLNGRTRYLPAESTLALVICVPLLVPRHTLPHPAFYAEWISAILFSLAVFLSAALSRREKPASLPYVMFAPIWLIACTLTQMWLGLNQTTGTNGIVVSVLALGAVVIFAAWRYANSASTHDRGVLISSLAIGWLAAGLLGTLAQWIQVFHLEPMFAGWVSHYDLGTTNRRLWGNLNQPNHQATVNGLALAGAIWLYASRRLRFLAWLGAVIWLESGIVLSGSRTGMAHIGIASVYLFLLAFLSRKENINDGPASAPDSVRLRAAGLSVLAILIALKAGIDATGDVFGWNLFDLKPEGQGGTQFAARSALWAHAWAMFETHPWLGVGWGEFAWEQFQQMRLIGKTAEMSLHAHNALLDMLAKTGLLGTVAICAVLAAWFVRVVVARILRGCDHERNQTIMILTCLAIIGAHSMLEYPLHYAYFFLPFCLMLGMLETKGLRIPVVPQWFSRLSVYSFALVTALVLGTTSLDYQATELSAGTYSKEVIGPPEPLIWFRPYAQARRTETKTITTANAAQLLPEHVAALHVLPTQNMVTRTAWLMALTGNVDGAKAWLERLPYYYWSDPHGVYMTVGKACNTTSPAAISRDFCHWIEDRIHETKRKQDRLIAAP
ncbi:hypothetical protein DFLDMN_003445 [Cupriavidus sp. H19C3]